MRPGFVGSTYNIMEVGGREVNRREPGRDAVHTLIKLTAGKRMPLKIVAESQLAVSGERGKHPVF